MPPERDRDETGRFADGIDPETALDVFDARTDAARPLTAGDVADELGIARRTAHNKLTDLADRGTLETRKVGAKGRVYWTPIPADSQRPPDSRESVETPSQPAADQHVDGDPSADMTSTDATDDSSTVAGDASSSADDLAAVVDRVAADEWVDSAEKIEARKSAALAVLEYARENGTISKREAKENIEPDHPVNGQNPRTWYRNNIRPVLNEVAEYDQSQRGYRLTLGDDR